MDRKDEQLIAELLERNGLRLRPIDFVWWDITRRDLWLFPWQVDEPDQFQMLLGLAGERGRQPPLLRWMLTRDQIEGLIRSLTKAMEEWETLPVVKEARAEGRSFAKRWPDIAPCP